MTSKTPHEPACLPFAFDHHREVAALSFIATLLLTACGPVEPSECREVPDPGLPANRTKTMRYALVDRSSSYVQYAGLALHRLSSALERDGVAKPGDRLTTAWISSQSNRPTEIFFPPNTETDLGVVEEPPIPSLPAKPMAPACDEGTTMRTVQCANQRADYQCKVWDWNARVAPLIENWKSLKEEASDNFRRLSIPRLRETPVVVDNRGTAIVEAIYEASRTLRDQHRAAPDANLKLLIFSDMEEYRDRPADKVPVRLDNIEVIVAMFVCERPAQCEKLQEEWTAFFAAAGAKIQFLNLAASTPERLAQLLQ